ncbi:MazG nucleotide pyrophosphohydrolase domain-containing protein [Salsuginibacillus kocurii]|uniref:MazG nucleotide pyrophosphohydrolase domain-containing protein n=1 Tax=Salsuginibacillus kocurii TaxID=427078 RepID=UPI00036C8F6F|nr:MazG-like family protein [Salsuginibacillus kocurii]
MGWKEEQKKVEEFSKQKGFEVTLEERLAYLTAEVGELTEEVLKYRRKESSKENVGAEIYDVVWNAIDLASLTGIDIEEASAL